MCCGKKRTAAVDQTKGITQQTPVPAPAPDSFAFRYVGDTSLTAVGSITGKTYRFTSKGAVQLVHKQDAVRLRNVPNLIQVD